MHANAHTRDTHLDRSFCLLDWTVEHQTLNRKIGKYLGFNQPAAERLVDNFGLTELKSQPRKRFRLRRLSIDSQGADLCKKIINVGGRGHLSARRSHHVVL